MGLYWDARADSLEVCTDRCFRSLSSLRQNGYSTFFLLGRSRKEALKRPFEASVESVKALLRKGINRTDIGREPIPDLGFSLRLWSGGDEAESYAISTFCGATCAAVRNNFLMNLPAIGPHSLSVSMDRASKVFKELIEIWEPDEGILCDSGTIKWVQQRIAPGVKSYMHYP
jgi:hypothetical protein